VCPFIDQNPGVEVTSASRITGVQEVVLRKSPKSHAEKCRDKILE
jgi:hypothetical protein